MAGKSRSLGSLLVNVGADTRALETGLKSATTQVTQFGNRTASTTKKAAAGFNNMNTAALGVGASVAAATGLGGLMALGPAAAAGVSMRMLNSLTSMSQDSPFNMMRKLKLEQRKMKFQMMSGPGGEAISNLNYYTNPGNLIDEAKVGFFEYLSGMGERNVFRDVAGIVSPDMREKRFEKLRKRFTPNDDDFVAEWNELRNSQMDALQNARNFGVSP